MLNFLQRVTTGFAAALQCFLRDPKRAVSAAGIIFGLMIVALYIVQVVAMFIPTTPVAATIAPLLANQNLAMIGLIAVIVLTQLGFDKLSLTLPNGASFTAEDARGRALEGLEKATEALTPEDPS